ncbi:MAG: urate hydroxylase PuuD, partial [Chloroflexota bacterium]
FTMISNHFPSTYGHTLNWLILAILMVGSAAVRHFMNIRFYYPGWLRFAAASALLALALVFVLIAWARGSSSAAASGQVSFSAVQPVIERRCVTCHAAAPTDPQFTAPPAGVVLESPEQIRALAQRIKERAVVTKSMPLGNKTGMTDEERALLGAWVDQGAQIP